MSILSGNKGQKLTLELVKNNFDRYNFIISTSSGTYDTSLYNICDYNASKIGEQNKVTGSQSGPILYLGYNSKGKQPLDLSAITPKDRYACILDKTVQEIKVKSRKNFLTN